MKPINRIFLFLLFISVSYAISYAQENQSYFLHTIEKGQSLYSISKMYNVTTSDIIRLNPGCDEKIYAGQTIKIPTGKESQKGETFHTIQAGETLYKLTTMYNVSAKDICEANPGLSAENFRIGQVILIPQKKEEQTATATQTPTEQTTIQGQLGAQPTGITCKAQGVNKLSFLNNQVYPDGRENLVLDDCNNSVIEGNNFKSYYNGILVLSGDDNRVNKNIFWLTGAVQNQMLDHGDDFGIINVKGDNNTFASNSLSCEWAYADAVAVNATQGTGNVFKNCFIDNLESYRVFLVNAETEVSNCVSSDKVSIIE